MPGLVTGERPPIINQPWEDMADDVTDAIEKAVQPLLRKATNEIYAGLLDATQDYLKDNLAFNIASRIDAAERQADQDRQENVRLREALQQVRAEIGPAKSYAESYGLEGGKLPSAVHIKLDLIDGYARAALSSQVSA
jgi:hypothetical protein